jgi:hypothetical protein
MSIKKLPLPARVLIPTGLLLVTAPSLLRDGFNIPIPDFFRGMLLGIGLALEILGIIMMKKEKIAG